MDGGDRSGYKQISKSVDACLITTTMGACSATREWVDFEIISTEALIVGITAPGLVNASLIDTGTTYARGAVFACSKITVIELSTKLAAGKVIAHNKVLI